MCSCWSYTKKMINLYYIHDPMCSWCWAFRPVWIDIQAKLSPSININTVLGGLATDSDQPMPAATRKFIIQTWKKITKAVPDIYFNFDFWDVCDPRRSTYPACRAIIAAKEQGEYFESKMIFAIQDAYYQQAKNPSNDFVLCELASDIGLDVPLFLERLNSEGVQSILLEQIQLAHKIGGDSFPSLFLQVDNEIKPLTLSYVDSTYILEQINMLMAKH